MDYSATKLSHSDPLTDVRAARLLEALDAERSRAVSPGGAWQAMGTAPRDGTPILVWVRWQNAPAGPAIVQWDAVGRGWRAGMPACGPRATPESLHRARHRAPRQA